MNFMVEKVKKCMIKLSHAGYALLNTINC